MREMLISLPITGELEIHIPEWEGTDDEAIEAAIEAFWSHASPLDVFGATIAVGDGWAAECSLLDVVRRVHQGGGVWLSEGPWEASAEEL